METIKFYKDVNNLWVLGDYASIAVRSVNLIKYADETINFEKNGSAMFNPNLKISQLVNASNEKYVADGTNFDEAINILKSATSDFFADAPALTGADVVNQGNIIKVDSIYGDDDKAINNFAIPFKTITSAKNSYLSGYIIVVYPGLYDECDLAKHGVTYYFMPGAIINYTGENAIPIFKDNDDPIIFNVYGYGKFISKYDIIDVRQNGSILFIEGDSIYSSEHRALANYDCIVTLKFKLIKSFDGVIDNIGASRGNCKTTVYADIIHGIGSFVIEHDGGNVEIYCNEIISESDDHEAITTATGSGRLFIKANKLTSNYFGLFIGSEETTISLNDIDFNTSELNIQNSGNPLLLSANNCHNGNLPYLTGLNGIQYSNRPILQINNGQSIENGVEPNILIVKTEVLDVIQELEISPIPNGYYLTKIFVKDVLGDFNNEGYSVLFKNKNGEEITNIQSVPLDGELIFPFKFLNIPIIYNDFITMTAAGDDLTGLQASLIFEKSFL